MKVIDRIKVLDISTHFSGSVASRHLGALGADVVKLENPAFGDGNRGLLPLIEGEAMVHIALNVGKRSIAVDRRSEDWPATLKACAQWADVVILGSQPDVAKKRGLDFASFVKMNPQIVYCNISGYGETGPWSNHPLHGLNGDVLAGLVPVQKTGNYYAPATEYRSVGTTLAGVHAALGIMEGLRRRDLGDGPQYVRSSVWESAMFWQWRDMTTFSNLGIPNPAYADLGSRYATYETSDHRLILICPVEEKFWGPFCELLMLPEDWKTRGSWKTNGMDWGKDREDEKAAIAERIKKKTFEEWNAAFDKAGVPFSPYYNVLEAMNTAQAEAVGVAATTGVNGKSIRVPNIPIHIGNLENADIAKRSPSILASPPSLGEHTEAFLKELGLHKPR